MRKVFAVILAVMLLSLVGCNDKNQVIADLFDKFDYSAVQYRIGINEETELSSLSKLQIEQLDIIMKLRIAQSSDYDETVPRPGEYAQSVVIHFSDRNSILFIGKDRIKVVVMSDTGRSSVEYDILENYDYDSFIECFD